MDYYIITISGGIRKMVILAQSVKGAEAYCKEMKISGDVRKATVDEIKQFENESLRPKSRGWKTIEKSHETSSDEPAKSNKPPKQERPVHRRGGMTIMKLVERLFTEQPNIGWEKMRDEVLKLKPDSKFNRAHWQWYKAKLSK